MRKSYSQQSPRARISYPGNNAAIFLIILAVSVAWLALRIVDRGDVPLLGVLLFGLGLVGYFMTRSTRTASRRQFDGDAGPATRPTAPSG